MSWTTLADIGAGICLLVGSLLAFVAALGMVRFPDLLSRMHPATKPQVLGLMMILLGMGLRLRDVSAVGLLLLVALFQLATAPIASHLVARASYRAGEVDPELLVLDELAAARERGFEEPRGAP